MSSSYSQITITNYKQCITVRTRLAQLKLHSLHCNAYSRAFTLGPLSLIYFNAGIKTLANPYKNGPHVEMFSIFADKYTIDSLDGKYYRYIIIISLSK